MASIEHQVPHPTKTPHLYYLAPLIRGFRHKYSFEGYSSDFLKSDEQLKTYLEEFSEDKLFSYVENNLSEICKELNSRWLLSILYCYVDGHSNREVQLQALAAANAIEFDRMHMSSFYPLKLNKEEYAELFYKVRDANPKLNVFDGLILYIGHADVLTNFYYRSEKLITHKEIDSIYRTLTARFCNSWHSLHAGMIMDSGRISTKNTRNRRIAKSKGKELIEEKIKRLKSKLV
jgi:hypothetical protein